MEFDWEDFYFFMIIFFCSGYERLFYLLFFFLKFFMLIVCNNYFSLNSHLIRWKNRKRKLIEMGRVKRKSLKFFSDTQILLFFVELKDFTLLILCFFLSAFPNTLPLLFSLHKSFYWHLFSLFIQEDENNELTIV